ncbi:malto-oligosyltrehalose trehalohydrolase [Mucilaginibacter paludis]|uniref:Malto-oligosyltrehalose trehalohydrolase n=1 Tax=Mucilaginibacter paludis DSM 18603 TaxID=714943 RepID=H1Y5I8_9SPHI|nr:malto-oligosyltrehalose trehalohydrolase [Mucilaginibacter paludis]EHQ29340.1 malto-oligosyltrehalose trehalohydrolase [Mucilaginibacter paludis DSM 18603]
MNKIAVEGRSVGVTYDDNGNAHILVWVPLAKDKVELFLPGDNVTLPLQKQDAGYWHLITNQVKPDVIYQFILDGDQKLADPASLFQPDGVHGLSQTFNVNDFAWTDSHWNNLPLNKYIFYELHTGTFTPEGTFEGIEKKLDYLKELGITAIEIMPVAQFPGSRNWGYDGVFPFAVQNSYGGPAGLQKLVNACHQKGLAVVLDVVYNHIGPEGNYLGEFGPYFTDKYKTPWGDAINFDDAWCDAVRQYYVENVLMWFRDFHIDALRMDAVHAIKDMSPKHVLAQMKESVYQLMEVTGRTHHLVIECDLNDVRYINPLDEGGYGIDAQWTDEFHHALRVTAGQEKDGYYSDFKGIADLATAYKNAYVYTGQYSAQRFKTFGTEANENGGQQFVVFSQNHDQVGNRMLGERTSTLHSFEMQKLLAAAVMVSPYLPMLFMGEELSQPNPFLYFVSHGDDTLIEAVRKGRKAEFADFHAEGEAPDPQAVDTFERSKFEWELFEREPHQSMLQYYKALIRLRKQNKVLSSLNRKNIKVFYDEAANTLMLHRWHDGSYLISLLNFSGQQQSAELPFQKDTWQKIFDSADPQWRGPSASAEFVEAGSSVLLQPQSILIYQYTYA